MGMSSDFRLTSNGTRVSDCAPKQVVMHNANWSGLLCYNGVARYGTHNTAQWLEDVLQHEWTVKRTPQQIADLVEQEANTWLAEIPDEHKRHTFTLMTYENGNPFVRVISNYERLGETNLPVPADTLFNRHRKARRPRCFVFGQAQAVTEQRRRHLESVLSEQPPAPENLRDALAAANRDAAAPCTTQHRQRGMRRGVHV
jgi:hypothetical protein